MAKRKSLTSIEEIKKADTVLDNSQDAAPSGYAGPGQYVTPKGDELTGQYALARANALYNAYGRNKDAIAMMRLDPSYAALRAAGIQTPGSGMQGTMGGDGKLIGGGTGSLQDAGAMYRSAGGASPVAQVNMRQEGAVTASPATATTNPSQPTRASVTAGAPGTSGGTALPDPVGEPAKAEGATPPSKDFKGPPAAEDRPATFTGPTPTKGPRMTTTREFNATRGLTEKQKQDKEFNKTGQKDLDDNLAARDKLNRQSLRGGSAEDKMAVAEARNQLQDGREKIKMGYDEDSRAADAADKALNRQAGYMTEKGDREIEQRKGEVQDRSQYGTPEEQARGVGKVTGRNITYMGDKGSRSPSEGPKGPNEKEMVTSTVSRGGTYTRNSNGTYRYEPTPDSVISLASAAQNKADAMKSFDYKNASPNKDASAMTNDEKFVGGQKRFDDEQGNTSALTTTYKYDKQKEVDEAAGKSSAGSNYSGNPDRGVQSPELTQQSIEGKNQGANNALNNKTFDLAPLNDKDPGYKGPSQNDSADSQDPKKKKPTADYEGPVGKNVQQA